MELSADQIEVLGSLVSGINPADEVDGGALEVGAAEKLAAKVRAGVNAALYVKGVELARSLTKEKLGVDVAGLTAGQIHELLEAVRGKLPGFFKQLRMDVSAIYLSDPAVWGRMGFPGPSAETGGHPDFDRPQTVVHVKGRMPNT